MYHIEFIHQYIVRRYFQKILVGKFVKKVTGTLLLTRMVCV